MKIQTLIVTTGQTDHSLLEKMNVQTDTIVGNQCDRNEVEIFEYNGYGIRWISMCERGVGLNRNTVMRTARSSNQSILKEISPGSSLEGLMLMLKLQYFGHLMRRADSFEKTLMLGKIDGRRRRGLQRMR